MEGRSKFGLALTYVRYRVRELYMWYTSTTVTVDTRLGRVRGVQYPFEYDGSGKKYAQFHGIPYARPPVGDLRFCVSVWGVWSVVSRVWFVFFGANAGRSWIVYNLRV